MTKLEMDEFEDDDERASKDRSGHSMSGEEILEEYARQRRISSGSSSLGGRGRGELMGSQKNAIDLLLATLSGKQREALLDLAQGPNLRAVGQLLEALREERGH